MVEELNSDDLKLLAKLAELEHIKWSQLVISFFKNSDQYTKMEWLNHANLSYDELPEFEKAIHKQWALKTFAIFKSHSDKSIGHENSSFNKRYSL